MANSVRGENTRIDDKRGRVMGGGFIKEFE